MDPDSLGSIRKVLFGLVNNEDGLLHSMSREQCALIIDLVKEILQDKWTLVFETESQKFLNPA